MKFQLIENPTCTEIVKVQVPTPKGVVEQDLKVKFRVRSMTELQAFEPMTSIDQQNAFLEDVVENFDDVVDEAGKPVVVTNTIRAQLLELPFVRNAILRDYTLMMAGAKTKN